MENSASSPGTATAKAPGPGTAPVQQQPGAGKLPTHQQPQGEGTPPAAPPKSKAERLADLLRDDPPGDGNTETPPGGGSTEGDDGRGGSRKQQQPPKPRKFNDLAERVGVELTDLYKLEIAEAADGSPVTVETLKDHWAKRSDFSVSQLQWEEERSRQQTELVRANAELRELLGALPRDAIKPEVLETVRKKHEQTVQREQAATLRVIPEWRDKETHTEELAGMAEWLMQYGFPAEYLKSVYDHRVLFVLRDSWRRAERMRKALEQVERADPPRTPSKAKHNDGKPPAKPAGERSNRPRGRAGLLALLDD